MSAEVKIVVSDPKTGRAKQFAVPLDAIRSLIGMKIGDTFPGDIIGLKNTVLKITGGSDSSGFPLHPAIPGPRKVKVLLSSPPGFKPRKPGERRKKMVRGNAIPEDIAQINTVIVEGSLPEEAPKEEGEEKEESS